MYVNVRAMGKAADPTIFQDSTFGKALYDCTLNTPKPEKVTDDSGYLQFVFISDGAFGISVNLMRPYPGNNLNKSQRMFNYWLSMARIFVMCTFGIFTNKWRIFHQPLNIKYSCFVAFLKAVCALHNYVCDMDSVCFDVTLQISGLHDCDGGIQQHLRGRNKAAYAYRDQFAKILL
ncbi:hypothetical protein PR048_010199 [Dryococelus australis]|uniref:DDE Tnp4 domain-containing protein n=1 Tax=Dryococelus australis TaxID=614101 RepID=A0ABQ9I201_9NEOP|nr:hypothetical protein PR048_010199 [Dryococelus australis]